MGQSINKSRYWWAVLYPENMVDNWVNDIDDILQLPYCYCYHSSDTDSLSEHRKDHLHIIIAFPNTTTYKHALSVFDLLSAKGKIALNKCEAVINMRNCYEYLIHNTESCKKKKKHLYDKIQRISGNNFDIGAFEQVGIAEKNAICKELAQIIIKKNFINFADFYKFICANYEDDLIFEVVKVNSGFFERLCKGNYLNFEVRRKK